MIPHALAHGVLKNGTETLEFSFLTLSPDGFTARFTKADAKRFLTGAAVEFVFFTGLSPEGGKNGTKGNDSDYETIYASTYSLQKLSEGDEAEVYEISVLENSFSQKVQAFSKAYLTYIQRKQTWEDDELAHAMTNPAHPYPIGEDLSFYQSRKEQEAAWLGEDTGDGSSWEKLFSFFSTGVAVETPWDLEDFSQHPYREWREYFQRKGMSVFPIGSSEIQGIALGNAYCPELLPSKDLFWKFLQILPKSVKWLIFALPPVSEEKEAQLSEYVSEIQNLFGKAEKHDVSFWWECADLGMETFLRKMTSGMPDIFVTKGVLQHKSLRDPRRRYLAGEEKCARRNLMHSDTALYLPYFQTNIGTFCPLAAAVRQRERGRQQRTKDCPHYCREAGFLYPKHLRLTGRYNGLFGFCAFAEVDCESLIKEVKEPIRKVVMNL